MPNDDELKRHPANGTWPALGPVAQGQQGYDRAAAKACVGPGWAAILDELFDAKPDCVRMVQVKEKYGTLRLWAVADITSEGQAAMQSFERAIDRAEKASQFVCEECGAPGVLHDGDWYLRTLCGQCAQEQPPME